MIGLLAWTLMSPYLSFLSLSGMLSFRLKHLLDFELFSLLGFRLMILTMLSFHLNSLFLLAQITLGDRMGIMIESRVFMICLTLLLVDCLLLWLLNRSRVIIIFLLRMCLKMGCLSCLLLFFRLFDRLFL